MTAVKQRLPLLVYVTCSRSNSMSLIQDIYQEYIALSDSYLSASAEEGLGRTLPEVRTAVRTLLFLFRTGGARTLP